MMPDLASRRLARTSWVLLPMDETMPIPVTTTRLIQFDLLPLQCFVDDWATLGPADAIPQAHGPQAWRGSRATRGSCSGGLEHLILFEQSNLEVAGAINDGAVRRQPAIGNAEHQFRAHDALEFDAVDDLLHIRQHLPGEFQLAEAQRAAFTRRAEPAEKEPDQLP